MNGLNNGLYDGLNNGSQNGLYDGTLNGLHNGLNSSDLSFDIDALKFINASGITSDKNIYAIKFLVYFLKSYGLWNKMKAIYPFIGGTATTHKWNLKDPRDLNAAFRLVFNGGWTHSITGALPNGTNAYARTYLIPNNELVQNDIHLSFYSRTNNNQAAAAEMGSRDGSDVTGIVITMARSSLSNYRLNTTSTYPTFTDTNSLGMMTITRSQPSFQRAYRNGILKNTTIIASNGKTLNDIAISAWQFALNTFAAYSSKQVAFSTIGTGLNDVDNINLYNIVQQYQTILDRQV